eukprot:symbB.v1.2.038872.t1/scaffold6218.1/size19993/2
MRATRIVGQVDSEMEAREGSPKNNYFIRDVWIRNSLGKARSQQQVAAALQRSQTSDRLERRSSMTSEDANEMIGNVKEGIWKHLIGSPTSPRRMIWDALGGVMILWDIVALPLMVFQEVDGLFMDILGMIGLMYWTMNVGITLTSGYLQNGVLKQLCDEPFSHLCGKACCCNGDYLWDMEQRRCIPYQASQVTN